VNTLGELASDWTPPIFITVGCVLSLLLYLRGYWLLRKSRPSFTAMRALAFCSGIFVLWVSLGSPLEELADKVLTAHMIEHLLLMSAVPPLVWLGWPTVPMLRGLPAWLRRPLLNPLLRSRLIRRGVHRLDSAVLTWFAMNLTLLAWHIPAAYDFALEHEGWHDFEHVCFLATSLLFWWVLLRPWPSRPGPPGWVLLVYLLTADFVNTALSATLAFVGRPIYGYYLQHPSPLGLDPLNDQQIGASIMWVFGSIVFLLPAIAIGARLLTGSQKPQGIATLCEHATSSQAR
jgi:cytochrome c oxidase assembly factor CtaG